MKFKPVYSKRSYRQALGRIQRYHSNPYLDWLGRLHYLNILAGHLKDILSDLTIQKV